MTQRFFVGRQYDGHGNAQPWWSDSTIAAFTKQVRFTNKNNISYCHTRI